MDGFLELLKEKHRGKWVYPLPTRWQKSLFPEVKFADYKFIVMPIHKDNHWALLVANIHDRTLGVLDSSGKNGRGREYVHDWTKKMADKAPWTCIETEIGLEPSHKREVVHYHSVPTHEVDAANQRDNVGQQREEAERLAECEPLKQGDQEEVLIRAFNDMSLAERPKPHQLVRVCAVDSVPCRSSQGPPDDQCCKGEDPKPDKPAWGLLLESGICAAEDIASRPVAMCSDYKGTTESVIGNPRKRKAGQEKEKKAQKRRKVNEYMNSNPDNLKSDHVKDLCYDMLKKDTNSMDHLLDVSSQHLATMDLCPVALRSVTVGNISLWPADLATLDDQHWLNDRIMDGFLELLKEILPEKWVYPLPILGQKLLFPEVKFADYKFIVMPILKHDHWALLVANIHDRTLGVLDSSGNTRRGWEYLEEWKNFMNRRGNERLDGWTPVEMESAVQEDDHSCGVFALINAEALARNKEPGQITSLDAAKYRPYIKNCLLRHASRNDGAVCDLPNCHMRKLECCGRCDKPCYLVCSGHTRKSS